MPELAKAYDPSLVEDKLYARWLEQNSFHADPGSSKPPYSIVIPPPNVTGVLTMGHVLNNTIQDILIRRARLQGKEALWLPGTDHAGLATQTAVEKALRKPAELPANVREVLESLDHVWDKAAGKPKAPLTRHNIGREAMLKLVWAWTKDRGGIIIQQLKKLGCSCDWKRERFTMDEAYHRDVINAFITLYKKGYIYRGKRMVNWCPASHTALSDEEVIPTPQKSKLYTMRYEIAELPGQFLEIATTRPETLMGDSAVAVNPTDERYKHLVGKHCWRPFPRAQIPIIADAHIDPAFGTGVLKVTPAHDKADFEIGQRHQLPIIDILHCDGKINCPAVPELDGLDRFDARKKAVEMLQTGGALVKEEAYENNIGFSERGQVPVEPRLSEQWFLDYRKMLNGRMIEEALATVRDKVIRFYPDRWEKVYAHWLENIQDWCLSRQVYWGHRIPVWYHYPGSSSIRPDNISIRDYMDRPDAGKLQEIRVQMDSPGIDWIQDSDSLDTWASSWLWAYATMDTKTRKKFYPTSTLVTGPDIIFLWVARMIIAGLEFNPAESAAAPGSPEYAQANRAFQDVYFTGIIRDHQGRKMSKSLGNSPDPLDLIAKYGADGLRFGLMRIAPQGLDIRFDEKQIEEGRNFCNKLWNACRFRAMQGPIDPKADPFGKKLTPYSAHLLARLDKLIDTVEAGFEKYEFSAVASAIYGFVWDDLCSRFLETAKADFADPASPTRAGTLATIDHVLSQVLRLLHPFAPFITEEIWIELGFATETIQFTDWPVKSGKAIDSVAVEYADKTYALIDASRRLRGEFQIPLGKKLDFKLHSEKALSQSELALLSPLLGAQSLEIISAPLAKTPVALTPLGDLYLPLTGLIDVEKEKQRLEKEIAKAQASLERESKKLENTAMLAKAPPEKVEEWRALKAEAESQLAKFREQLVSLG
ncbi:MAG: valine--tRNA ligase [Methylacidiphilales bacterium]|nr:valine--tRNA ligase [Candidatus Methylacidiphilales bacterium]